MGRNEITGLGLLLLLTGCGRSATEPTSPAVLPVEAVTAVEDSRGLSQAYPAVIGRDREADLSARVGGSVLAAPLRIGDRIPAGTLVVRLDATPARTARREAQAEVDRLARDDARNERLLPAGAVSTAVRDDTRSALDAARAVLARSRYDEASASVVMPFNGVVLSDGVEVGETVAAGATLLTVADLSSARLARVAVPSAVAADLQRGDRGSVSVRGYPVPFTAIVRRLGQASDARTGTVQVELTLDGADTIASGTVASATFQNAALAEQTGAVFPAEVLLDARDGFGHVYIVDPTDSTARRVRVRIVAIDGDGLRLAGLAPDVRVITAGAGFVADGQRVSVTGR
ncbi:hypothetical protein BZG35_16605 [Brevundimonas sp. LM2]|uniref:efflux RND transporter periplasmic adaptor subunit n=1 Tax=Brevundimonas sp. LM2 TaxID=1938605 RepID=UPI00098393EE|nr:efflux RND transporter periplasmic adaptor subunit [Brevundimonas sp. LM2]AQR63093.1 hypothetical protein BZG35_16605 [Brevundimonas sp. LM2]